ncbi:metalloregulator ArsR/SmtB family transcription factor [Patescibacteria group bacterium]|nr:metalloregulator ArsR/SmtB family transcription factor [Patescibacteria group bacterium]MBU4512967.1 metalloregulator ArsR/SmtB family transcription factor [Patescibacteria group bacterium]MCG2693003.1 metalloregulator ArsR/SmtB family transcription factor [Candidatus Parcubacteria bacterium]
MRQLSKKFKALGNEKRLSIMKMMLNNEKLTVGDTASKFRISIKGTSKHLLVLESAGFIKRIKDGMFVYYDSNFKNQNKPTQEALKFLKMILNIKK